ncbi:very long chain fatty acid elongase AAEL008004 [Anabrus simplex]|uniref:very long chain fatty acid elongase AAEL008004 n=1 Tax=Anabrus simplex TaxID=316456 RepID=UPI0035A30B05
MATGVQAIVDGYKDFMATKSDPRTSEWFLMSGPAPLVTILVSYLYFSTTAGPRYMKDRKPYQLKHVLMVYNLFQVVFSIWLVGEGLQAGWLNHYSYKCQPVDYSDNPLAMRMARACWWYFMCKIVELLDTVFFVLRKKNRQISYLHLWHHTMMPICAWIGTKFLAGGHGTLLGLINTFVHVIMYTYYLLAALGPQYQKYLWWKKYLTTLQMIQFVIVFLHNAQLLVYECNYPKTIVVLLTINALYFLYLFGAFYYRTYVLKKDNTKNE